MLSALCIDRDALGQPASGEGQAGNNNHGPRRVVILASCALPPHITAQGGRSREGEHGPWALNATLGQERLELSRLELRRPGAGSSHFAQRRTAQLAAAGAAPVNHWFLRASSPAIALIYRLQEPMSAGRACARTWLQLLASRGVCRSFRTGDDHSDGRPGTTSRLASEITYIWKWRGGAM